MFMNPSLDYTLVRYVPYVESQAILRLAQWWCFSIGYGECIMMMNIVIQNAWLLHWTNLPIVSPYILVSGTCQLLALPFTIAVACVIIAILTATIIVLYRKLRQRNSSEAIKISTEGKSKLSEVKTQELTMQWITMWMMKRREIV